MHGNSGPLQVRRLPAENEAAHIEFLYYRKMMQLSDAARRLRVALCRARSGFLWMVCAYGIGLFAGIVLAHLGHAPSLAFRDRIVSRAQASSPILRHLQGGRPGTAAALDFAANLTGATLTAMAGWYAPAPVPLAVYRGWIGGIVSVDAGHRSRFRTIQGGFYYGLVVMLQLAGYILSGGAGVNLGLARTRARAEYPGARFLGIPKAAIQDAACIYILVVPIFAMASALEFFW